MSVLVEMATANNTVAIVIAGPIAKEIGDQYQVEPKAGCFVAGYFCVSDSGVDSIWGATAFGGIVNRIITF